VGLGLAKSRFRLVVLDTPGREIEKQRLFRGQVIKHFIPNPRCLISQGHEGKLIPPR